MSTVAFEQKNRRRSLPVYTKKAVAIATAF